jgi:SAM-dependent methyltransferase
MSKLVPLRRCLKCDAVEVVAANEPVWPPGWKCINCGSDVPQVDGIPLFAPNLADTISGFDPRAFEELARLEDEHFWFIARNQLITGLAEKFFPAARRFLEVGCGTGYVLRALASSRTWDRLVGSELHPSGLAYARRRLPPNAELVQMDARDIPAEAVFDLCGAFDVIEHIAEDEVVLRSMRAATLTGGGAIIAVPQHPMLWSRADETAHHQRRYRRGELEEKLRRCGFEVIFSSSFNSLLLPLIAASRLIGREREEDVYEFSVPPVIARVLLATLRAEVWMTLKGAGWPAGGSRVVVARAV